MGRPWALGKRIESARRHWRKLLRTDPRYRSVVRAAKAAGCKVEFVHHMHKGEPTGTVRNTMLVINGLKCALHFCSNVIKHPSLQKETVRPTFQRAPQIAAHVCRVGVPGHRVGFFVVPRRDLRGKKGIT